MKVKEKYISPDITIEELAKQDVLCASNEQENPDNIQQSLLNFGSWWD